VAKSSRFGRSREMASKKRAGGFRRRLKEIKRLWDERADQERMAWLSRPRLHTALFEEVWRYEEYERLARSVSPDIKHIIVERRDKLEQIKNKLGWSDERLASFQKLIVDYRRTSNVATYLEIRRSRKA
jgi:hypothetical protein